MNEQTTPQAQVVWVVLSHGDAGAFVSHVSASEQDALTWAKLNEIDAEDAGTEWEPDEASGAGWVWDNGDSTVRVTPVEVTE